MRPAAVWSPNPRIFLTAPGVNPRSPATPPFRLNAREIPDLVTGKTVAHYGAPEAAAPECAARLRRAPFFSVPRSVARYGSHGAPRAPLNSPGEQPANPRKQPEIRVFHSVDKFFPLCGKSPKSFSIVWKKWPVFSTVWKIFFHSVEKSRKSFPYCGKPSDLAGTRRNYKITIL